MTIVEFIILFGSSFVIGLSGAMMPGPVTTMAINESLSQVQKRRARLVGPALATGHSILEIGLMFALWAGASFIFSIPVVLLLIGVIGGGLLVVFGILGMKSVRTSHVAMRTMLAGNDRATSDSDAGAAGCGAGDVPGANRSLLKPFWFGFLLSATSSGWWAWWASIGMNAITLSSELSNVFIFANFTVFITFYTGHIASDFAWFSTISFIVAAGKRRIRMRVYDSILFITNLFLIAMGIYFIVAAVM